MSRIAHASHPHCPQDWLSKQQVEKILSENGFGGTHCTLQWCKSNNIATGGHDSELYIDKRSLDSFIKMAREYAQSIEWA